MYFPRACVFFFAAELVSGVPVIESRAKVTDADILNYALTLEHLEDNFYQEGLSKFSEKEFAKAGFDQTFYNNLKKISKDESDHVAFITQGLQDAGATPVEKCTYNFGFKDVSTFLATASILEGVGVSAYLGAAAQIMSKAYLTAAGSILTVEARHSAYLRSKLNKSPYPQAFDTPLSLNEVYSLASPFIVSCPKSNPALPVKAFPALSVTTKSMSIQAGDILTLKTMASAAKSNAKLYAAFIAVTGPTVVAAKPGNGCYSVTVPKGFSGQTYVVLTTSKDAVTDDTTIAGPALIELR